MQVHYKFYATLLDSFSYYLGKVDDDNAYQDMLDRLNRVPFSSKAAEKGTAFNDLVDDILIRNLSIGNLEQNKRGNVLFGGFDFKPSIVEKIVQDVRGSLAQVFVSAILPTKKGNVELYGYMDYLKYDTVTDLKTTGRYDFPKFLNSWQSKVYPFCCNESGIYCDRFRYLVTDFSNIYVEEYPYKPDRDIVELQRYCEQLIDFIEANKGKLNFDEPKVAKLFGLEIAEAHENIS